jgi:hypothetical protein
MGKKLFIFGFTCEVIQIRKDSYRMFKKSTQRKFSVYE